jgi:hypothetical protein
MTKVQGFNMPGDDFSGLPRFVQPTAEDLRAMKTYLESRGVPRSYFDSITGSIHEGVAIRPEADKPSELRDKS